MRFETFPYGKSAELLRVWPINFRSVLRIGAQVSPLSLKSFRCEGTASIYGALVYLNLFSSLITPGQTQLEILRSYFHH